MPELRVAIIGTGFGLRTQLPGFRLAGGWTVVSLTGRDLEKTRRLAAVEGVPRVCASAGEAIEAGDPDLVCVSTPPRQHLPMAVAAVTAGRHCLLEKPMARDAAEAGAIVDARRGSPAESLALIDHELRALPNAREMRRRLQAGDIGRPVAVGVRFASHSRGQADAPWGWWSQREEGGGVLGAIGSHVVDMVTWWLGEISEVQARLSTAITERPHVNGGMRRVETDDAADLLVTFRSGVTGTLTMTTVAARYGGIRWEVLGTEGALSLEPDGRLLAVRRRPGSPAGAGRPGASPQAVDLSVDDALGPGPLLDGSLWARGFIHLAQAVGRAIREGTEPPFGATFADGLRTQIVLDAARQASDEGRRVRVG